MTERSTVTPLMRSVRDRHVSMILRQLLREPLARKELARRTEISFTTITRLVSTLIAAGIIEELPARRNSTGGSGRPQVPLGFPDLGRVVIGAHIRATTSTVSGYTLTGEKVAGDVVDHDGRPRHVLSSAIELTDSVIDGIGRDRVVGVGVSAGGVVDFASGTVMSSPQLGWSGVALREPFAAGLGLPVVVDNSVRALAISQFQQAAGDESSVLVVWVAGIVSAALIVDRQVHRGPGATAGTVAHLSVPHDEEVACPCGRRNCLGRVATDDAALQRALREGRLPEGSTWEDLYAAEADDPGVAAILAARAASLGEGVAQMIEVINPDVTVVAGHIGSSDDVRHCMDVVAARCRANLGSPRPVRHWAVDESEWDRASAAVVLDDYLRHATRYEASLLGNLN